MSIQLLRQFFLKNSYTILFSAKSLTATPSFHLNHKFYVVTRRKSSIITPLQKNLFSPQTRHTLLFARGYQQPFLTYIPHVLSVEKGNLLKKSYFAPLSM